MLCELKNISEISTFSSHRHKFKTQKQWLGCVQTLSNNYNTKDKNVRVLSVDSAFANKVSIPETCWTVYKKCVLHQSHKVMQDKKGKDSMPRKAALDRKQRGCTGRWSLFCPQRFSLQRNWCWGWSPLSPTADLRGCCLWRDVTVLSWEVIRGGKG